MSPLYGYVMVEGEEPSGWGGNVTLRYGVTEAIGVQLSGIWTAHEIAATEERDGGTLHMFSVAAGGAYALDLLDFTPVLEFGLGLLHRRLREGSATDLGILAGISAHYWFFDWLAIGFSLHYHAFLTDLRQFPIYVDLGPSIAASF